MNWTLSNRMDKRALPLADRHYNRQKVGSPKFVPPGRCLVLLTENADAVWVTSWPFARYVRHAWAGAWVNSLFRNESRILSSELILEAVAITRWYRTITNSWKVDPEPELGMITFVDASKVKSRNPGYCYKKAGFKLVGKTKGGKLALQMLPGEMPEPKACADLHPSLF